MLFAAFCFSLMSVCVKLASDLYPVSEIVMYRGLVGTVLLALLIRLQGGTLKTSMPWHHLWRGVVGVVALWMWFYAIGQLPLATAMTLNYTAPVWIAAFLFTLGWWRGLNKFEWGLAAAVLFSFAGVILLLRPSFDANEGIAGLVGLGSGMLSALAYMQVRKLGLMGEPEYRVVFYFSLTGVAAGILGSWAEAGFDSIPTLTPHEHTSRGLLLLLATGVAALIAQIAMTRAYRLGNTLVTSNLQYTGIAFSSIWGLWFWGDNPDWLGWSGIGIILLSGIAATFYNVRRSGSPAPAAASITRANDPIATEL